MSIKTIILLLGVVVMPFGASAVSDGGEVTPIIIYETETPQHSVPPKAPAILPLVCSVFSSLLFVEAVFYYDLGSVAIELENRTTGEYGLTLVNALPGTNLLPFSGTSGSWTITFTLSSGAQYYGEFDI